MQYFPFILVNKNTALVNNIYCDHDDLFFPIKFRLCNFMYPICMLKIAVTILGALMIIRRRCTLFTNFNISTTFSFIIKEIIWINIEQLTIADTVSILHLLCLIVSPGCSQNFMGQNSLEQLDFMEVIVDNNKIDLLKLQYYFAYFLIELIVKEKLTWNEESSLFCLNSQIY